LLFLELCDVALVDIRELVTLGFLTDELFPRSIVLDTEELLLVTFVFLVGVTLVERWVSVLLGVETLVFVLVVALLRGVTVLVVAETLVAERAGVAVVLRVVVVLVTVELLPLKRVALVLAIVVLLRCACVLILRSLLFLGVCA
jgi:hypothetical protein